MSLPSPYNVNVSLRGVLGEAKQAQEQCWITSVHRGLAQIGPWTGHGSTRGVPPVARLYLTLATGVSGAVIPREGKQDTLKVIDQPGTRGRLQSWSEQKEKKHSLPAVSSNKTALTVGLI